MATNPVDPTGPLEWFGFPHGVSCRQFGGGFSDARVWHVEEPPACFALKAYGLSKSADHLDVIHALLLKGRQAGVEVLPRVFRTNDGGNLVRFDGRLWDLVSWQPGDPFLASLPTRARLAAVGRTLGRLHQAWQPSLAINVPCPAVRRRLAAFDEWDELVNERLPPACESIADALRNSVAPARQLLVPWTHRLVPVQPCHCDPWHAHILFVDDEVSGLVDHASVKMDHVAVDLARFLGSLELPADLRAEFLSGFESVRPLNEIDRSLIAVLEPTGVVAALIGWMRKLAGGLHPTNEINQRIEFLIHKLKATSR